MGRMDENIPVDAKTIESALAHAGANLENQNTALISDETRGMIFGLRGFDEYIWYRGNEAFCTACGNDVDERYIILHHNQEAQCPVCGRAVTVKNARLGHKKLRQEFYTVEWRKSAIEKDAIVMIGFYCGVDYRNSEKAEKIVVPVLLDVFRYGKSAVRYQRSVWSYGAGPGKCEWYMRRDVRSISRKYFGHPFDVLQSERNFAKTLQGTPFDSAYRTMLEVESAYCRITGERSELISAIARRPWLEYMAKAGFKKIAFHARYSIPRGMLAVNKKNIREILKLSVDRYAELRGKKEDVSFGLLDVIRLSDAAGARLKLAEAKAIEDRVCRSWVAESVLKRFPLDRPLCKYLMRIAPGDMHWLRDYWDAAAELGFDLSDYETRLPRNLREAHDRAVMLRNDMHTMERNEKLRKKAETMQGKLNMRLEKLRSKYCFEACGMVLRPAESCAELIAEGNALHHCVGGYVERYATGGTDICFLRKADAPDTPWRTIEIDPKSGKVRQDRGDRNDIVFGKSTMTPELRAELEAFWSAFYNRKLLRDAV